MSPIDQQIAIAESRGFKVILTPKEDVKMHVHIPQRCSSVTRPAPWRPCPDYLNSLDEMAKVIASLTPEQAGLYVSELARMIGKIETRIREFHVAYVGATAAQRAEAYLKAIGKWRDGPAS